MKKKALALLLAMAMTATMAGCGLAATTAPDNSSNNDPTKSDNTEVGTYGSSAETQGMTDVTGVQTCALPISRLLPA